MILWFLTATRPPLLYPPQCVLGTAQGSFRYPPRRSLPTPDGFTDQPLGLHHRLDRRSLRTGYLQPLRPSGHSGNEANVEHLSFCLGVPGILHGFLCRSQGILGLVGNLGGVNLGDAGPPVLRLLDQRLDLDALEVVGVQSRDDSVAFGVVHEGWGDADLLAPLVQLRRGVAVPAFEVGHGGPRLDRVFEDPVKAWTSM